MARRLRIVQCPLPNPESELEERSDGQVGRFCNECKKTVTKIDSFEKLGEVLNSSEPRCVQASTDRFGRLMVQGPMVAGVVLSVVAVGCSSRVKVEESAPPGIELTIESEQAADGWVVDEASLGRLACSDTEQCASTISGTVRFAEGSPVSELTVVLRSSLIREELRVLTDKNGHYRMENLPAGEYVVQFSEIFRTKSQKLILPARSAMRVNATVHPEPSHMIGILIDVEEPSVPMRSESSILWPYDL